MILTGTEIYKNYKNGFIKFSNFEKDLITTNSYDLRLGSKLLFYKDKILDPKKNNKFEIVEIPKTGYELPAYSFVLSESSIKLGSDCFVPIIHGKSSIARLGVFVHITADLFDIGYYGKSTFQIHNLLPIKLYPGMLFAQVSFWVTKGNIKLYQGKYQNSDTVTPSKINIDFEELT